MIGVATALAWVLAGLLTYTGVAKLRTHGATAASFAALGLPLAGVLAWMVSLAELATAAALLTVPIVGGIAALVLLLAFTAFLASRLRGGAPVSCGCFGSARAVPLTSASLLRNALLAAAAIAVVASPAVPGLPPLEAAILAGTAGVIGMLAVGLWDLRARTGQLWDNHPPTGPEGLA